MEQVSMISQKEYDAFVKAYEQQIRQLTNQRKQH